MTSGNEVGSELDVMEMGQKPRHLEGFCRGAVECVSGKS